MIDAILVLNAGSSSLKFSIFRDAQPLEVLMRGQFEALQSQPRFSAHDSKGQALGDNAWPDGSKLSHREAIEFLFKWSKDHTSGEIRIVAAGHRIVHGGTKFDRPARVDADILAELESLIPLAPLHQPHNLAPIRAIIENSPYVPQVVCFDTSFHRTQPYVAQQFALPRELTAAGIQRYGFHGLSYEYISSRLPSIAANAAAERTIVAHLGNGASLCAMQNGISVATTMGFTPLDGLPMGTRCGAIDPGVLLYLLDHYQYDSDRLSQLLTYESGLLGVSSISSDMRTLLEKKANDPRAREAIELFVYRVAREIGSLAAALNGLDAIVFTGGIGEHAPPVRDGICRAARWLGVDLDSDNNQKGSMIISQPNSRVLVLVVPTDEELMIAQHTKRVLAEDQATR
jgi:acetate kinase